MTIFNLSVSNTVGNHQNKLFPNYNLIEDAQTLLDATTYDHSPANFKNDLRLNENFIESNVIVIDFDYKENKTIAQFLLQHREYEFYIVPSRNHQKVKESDGKREEACDRYHVYFPLNKSYNKEQYEELLNKFVIKFGSDKGAKGAARFFFGNPNLTIDDIVYNEGNNDLLIEDVFNFVERTEQTKPIVKTTYNNNNDNIKTFQSITEKENYTKKIIKKCLKKIEQAEEGSRNATLNEQASILFHMAYGDYNINENDIYEDIFLAAKQSNPNEISNNIATIEKARNYGQKQPWKCIIDENSLNEKQLLALELNNKNNTESKLASLEKYVIVTINNEARIVDIDDPKSSHVSMKSFLELNASLGEYWYYSEGAKRIYSMSLAQYYMKKLAKVFSGGLKYDPSTEDRTISYNGKLYLNIYRSNNITPKKGDKHLPFVNHIKEVWCDNDEESYEWTLDYLAHIFQNPKQKPGQAIVVKSQQGVGKSIIAKILQKCLDNNKYDLNYSNVYIANNRSFDSQFNSHYLNKLLIVGEEMVYSGSRKTAAFLKDIITNDCMDIEGKGTNRRAEQVYNRMIFFSNEDHAIHLDLDDRRMVVLEASLPFHPNTEEADKYFQTLAKMVNDEEAISNLLYYFLNERSEVTLERLIKVPLTEAKKEQIILSNEDSLECFVQEGLENGIFDKEDYSATEIYKEYLTVNSYTVYSKTQFSMKLKKIIFKHLTPKQLQNNCKRKDGKRILPMPSKEQIYKNLNIRHKIFG